MISYIISKLEMAKYLVSNVIFVISMWKLLVMNAKEIYLLEGIEMAQIFCILLEGIQKMAYIF